MQGHLLHVYDGFAELVNLCDVKLLSYLELSPHQARVVESFIGYVEADMRHQYKTVCMSKSSEFDYMNDIWHDAIVFGRRRGEGETEGDGGQ